jgi:hypothetical protein
MKLKFVPLLFPFLLVAACLFVTTVPQHAHADIEGAPFIPEIDRRFNALEQGNHYNYNFPSGSIDSHYSRQFVQATYNFAVNGGAVGTHGLSGLSMPKNAIFIRSSAYSITQPVGAGATLSFFCAAAGDIVPATAPGAYAAAGASIDGTETGPAANFHYTAAPCNIQYTIAGAPLTAGEVTVYLEYEVHQ